MTLEFMQHWPKRMAMQNEKTHFVQKVWNSLLDMDYDTYSDYLYPDGLPNQLWNVLVNHKHNLFLPKIHTIRHDESERWRPGIDIHFVINSRSKDRFQFAPVVKCTSVQTIEIIHKKSETHCLSWVELKLDGRLLTLEEIKILALNDGFESMGDFLNYFDKDFKGRLIHWTALKY